MPYSITREDAARDSRALRSILASLGAVGVSTSASVQLTELAESIEEQVKPAVEEPKEFGSVVRAGYDEHTDRVLWVRASGGWYADAKHGFHATFAGLHDPEVLRVGIGGEGQVEAYGKGRDDFATAVRRDVSALRAEAITSERKDAYDKALATVAALLGES
jgi:hypothetical protein